MWNPSYICTSSLGKASGGMRSWPSVWFSALVCNKLSKCLNAFLHLKNDDSNMVEIKSYSWSLGTNNWNNIFGKNHTSSDDDVEIPF